MIVTLNGKDTVKTLAVGKFRAHRLASFWIGDYTTFSDAARALQIANFSSDTNKHGFYDGGVNATEAQHLAAHADVMGIVFGHENCVTQDDVDRTILPGEPCSLQGGFPVRVRA
jgi:hypothetical protein